MIIEYRFFKINNTDSDNPDLRVTQDLSMLPVKRLYITVDSIIYVKTQLNSEKIRIEVYRNGKLCYKTIVGNIEKRLEFECNEDIYKVDSDPIAEIKRFQKDRLLDKQPFKFKTEVLNILEELVEMTGEKSETARKIAKEIFKNYFESKLIVNREELVDCFADIQVYSIGSIMKLGYDPKCVLTEVSCEINSRVGRIIDGKFVKDESPEARAKWYKADFSKCKVTGGQFVRI